MTARVLLAYVPWFAREMFPKALVPVIFCLALGGIPIGMYLGSQELVDLRNNAAQADFVRNGFASLAPLCFTLGAFLFMTQSVALDRERQHVRFLFAQPVSPPGYYFARWLVGLAMYLALFAPLPLALHAFGVDVPLLGSLLALLATLVLIGGLTTLCAALVQREGVPLIITYIGVQMLQALGQQDVLPDWAATLARGLPPIVPLGDVTKLLVNGVDWPTTDLLHVFGYGLGMFAAGLLVVRRAPLVR